MATASGERAYHGSPAADVDAVFTAVIGQPRWT
jgi:hypothetical protein